MPFGTFARQEPPPADRVTMAQRIARYAALRQKRWERNNREETTEESRARRDIEILCELDLSPAVALAEREVVIDDGYVFSGVQAIHAGRLAVLLESNGGSAIPHDLAQRMVAQVPWGNTVEIEFRVSKHRTF